MTILTHPDFASLTISDSLLYKTALTSSKGRGTLSQTLTGHAVYQVGKIVTGQAFTIEGSENYGIITHTQLTVLQAMSDIPKVMTLNYSGQFLLAVMFDYTSGSPINASKIQLKHLNTSTDFYNNVTIKLIKV